LRPKLENPTTLVLRLNQEPALLVSLCMVQISHYVI
jgi:hypothetical protein